MFWISHFASGISSANSFSQCLLWALRQTLPLVFHMAIIFNSQECLESGICMFFQNATFAYWSWSDGMVPRNLHMCGYLQQSDAYGFVVIFYPRKGGAWLWLFPLCWQQQGRWRVLLLRAWFYHRKWDGRWRTQRNGRRRHWCLPQTLCPLGAHSNNGVIVKGGCHFFFSDQGPLLKGGGDVGGGSILEKESLIFLFVCLEAEMSLRVMRPTSSDAKLTGGGLMWPCRPLHFA